MGSRFPTRHSWRATSSRASSGGVNRFRSKPGDFCSRRRPSRSATWRLLWRAAERLGIGADAAAPAEAEGLIELSTRVRFRHPLVRSAAYRTAGLRDRQEVHRALAEATDPEADPDRRAWHRAHAAVGPDEEVARELERSADRARGRGGVAAAAAFLERAAELTPDPTRRGVRAVAAAQAKFEAAAPDAAYDLLATAELGPLDDLQRALLARLRAQIVFARRRGNDAAPLLLDAARQLETLDDGLTRETYLEALGAAIFAGRRRAKIGTREVAAGRSRRAAGTAAAAADRPPPGWSVDAVHRGLRRGVWRRCGARCSSFGRTLERNEDDVMRWLWLPWLVAGDLWDDELWHDLATRAVRLGRESGALTVLPLALVYRAAVHLHAGEFAAASALIEEADAITEATGNAPVRHASLLLVAWRGEEAQALQLIEASAEEATARGEGRAIGLASWATAVLYNGLGRYEAALASAQQACESRGSGGLRFRPRRACRGERPKRRRTRRPLLPCDDSRNEPRQPTRTGRSASRLGHVRC